MKVSNTCIAVMEVDGVVYMAGDRRVSWDWSQAQSMPVPKINKRCEMLIGATGSAFLTSIIVDVIQYPKIKRGEKQMDYMINVICKEIRESLIGHGFRNGFGMLKIPSDYYAEAVFVIRGKAFSISVENRYDSDSADGSMAHVVGDAISYPYATGCGGQWAWGVIHEHGELINSGKLKMTPETSLTRALKVAAKYSPGCDSKIDIINNKKDESK